MPIRTNNLDVEVEQLKCQLEKIIRMYKSTGIWQKIDLFYYFQKSIFDQDSVIFIIFGSDPRLPYKCTNQKEKDKNLLTFKPQKQYYDFYN